MGILLQRTIVCLPQVRNGFYHGIHVHQKGIYLKCNYCAAHIFKKNGRILLNQHVRNCFHPGVSSLSRENLNYNESQTVSSRQMLKIMLSYVWPKDNEFIRNRVKLSLLLLVSAKLLNTGVPFIFKNAVDYLNSNTSSAGSEALLTLSTASDTVTTIAVSLLIGYGLARAGASGFNELRNAVFARVAQHSIRNIACNVFLHLHSLDLNFHLSRQTGALAKIIDRGSRGINFVLSALVFNIVPTIFELALVSTVLGIKYGPKFAGLSISCVFLYSVFTLVTTQWRTKFRIHMNRAENDAGNKAIDSLINYETVKYFNNEKYELERYDSSLKKYQDAALKTSTSLAFLNFGQNVIFTSAISLAMVMASKEILQGNMSIGDLVMINGLLLQLSMPLGFLGSVYREVRQALIDMQAMVGLMTAETQIKSSSNAKMLDLSSTKTAVEFKNVRFNYASGKSVFSDLSFTIPTGKKIAIIGPSGTGKSSIVRLLFRFYEPMSGTILIGNNDVRDIDLDSLRSSIAVVPQDSVLFNETIFYNLHYGNLKKSREDVYEAAKIADIHNTIMKWPKGYDTQVGERGLKLSGGEKQRVAIARTVLKNSPIVIFDEATSSLDSMTEHNILSALERATKGKTSICIAHRLSTIMDADEIFVLNDGMVIEKGSHDEFLRNSNSLYYKLWKMQRSV